MAYISKNLSVLAYANGFTLWHYTTPDTAATVDNIGYFNAASDMLRTGDMILANTSTGGTMLGGVFFVNQNSGGVVDIADQNQFGAVDTD